MMKTFVVGIILGVLLHTATHAVTFTEKDRQFLGGAAAGYLLSNMLRDRPQEQDPDWNYGWYDGQQSSRPYTGRRARKEDHCPTVTWCTRAFHDFDERNACIRGVTDCVEEATQIDWNRVNDAYFRGRGR